MVKGHLMLLLPLGAIKNSKSRGKLVTRDLLTHRDAITFDQLWMIFKPGSIVVSMKDKAECAFEVLKPEVKKNKQGCWFVLDSVCTDWDSDTYEKGPFHYSSHFFNLGWKDLRVECYFRWIFVAKRENPLALWWRGERSSRILLRWSICSIEVPRATGVINVIQRSNM